MPKSVGAFSSARIVEALFWALVTITLIGWHGSALHHIGRYEATVWAGVAVTLFGVRAFIGDGGGRVTALGLFNLSTALFVGFGAIYAGTTRNPTVPPEYLFLATISAYIAQMLVTLFTSGKAGHVKIQFPHQTATTWMTWAGISGLAIAGTAKAFSPEAAAQYVEATAFTAIVVLTVGLFWRPKARLISWASLLTGTAVIMYAEVFHIGSGRLRIVALVCAIGVIVSARCQRRALKWAAIAAIGPALYWLAQDRKELQESLSAGASFGRTGLESMTEPIIVFGQVIRANLETAFPLSYGANLLSYPAAYLPADWAKEAPQALGYELVRIWAPDKYGTGYSVAATSSGEAYYNFGFLGLALMVPALVFLLNLLDRTVVRSMSTENAGALPLLGIVFWAMLAGGISDLTWSGQHTFLTRATTRVPLWFVLVILAFIHARLTAKNAIRLGGNPRVQRTRKAQAPRVGAT